MLQGIKELKAVLNEQGFYDVMVNGELVGEMISKYELAEYVSYVLQDPEGMMADILKEEGA